MELTNQIAKAKIKTIKPSFVFAHSYWDILPVLAGVGHLAYLITMFMVFNYLPWWGNVLLGLGYAWSISWNINGVSHFLSIMLILNRMYLIDYSA